MTASRAACGGASSPRAASANRAAALTHRLLAFARRQPLDPKPVNANTLVTSLEDLLRRLRLPHIRRHAP